MTYAMDVKELSKTIGKQRALSQRNQQIWHHPKNVQLYSAGSRCHDHAR